MAFDHSLPFYNLILKCDAPSVQPVRLPEGFAIVPYRAGYERDWAALETEAGDFATEAEAESYFRAAYMGDPAELAERVRFLLDPSGAVAGSCIAWHDPRNGEPVSSLHWLVVAEARRGAGLGRALCQDALNFYARRSAAPVWIHTQPWSWRAVLLYVSLGFHIERTDTFSHYENQYAAAMETLRGALDETQYQRLLAASHG